MEGRYLKMAIKSVSLPRSQSTTSASAVATTPRGIPVTEQVHFNVWHVLQFDLRTNSSADDYYGGLAYLAALGLSLDQARDLVNREAR